SFSGGREQVSGAASTRAVPFLFFGTKSAASGRGKNQRTFTWGSFCFRESSGAKRSPRRSTRRKAASASKESRKGSFARMHSRTSSQVIGSETVGRSRARSEYTQTVVLCGSFWLQSTRTFAERSDFFMFETTSCGHFVARASATARANGLVCSYVARALSGR